MSIPASIRRKYLSNFLAIVLAVTGLQAIAISSAPTASAGPALSWTQSTIAGAVSNSGVYGQTLATSTDGSKVFVAATNRAFLSTNYGVNWTTITALNNLNPGRYQSAADMSADGTKIYYAFKNQIYYSWDSGQTWTNKTFSTTSGLQVWTMDASNDGTKLLITNRDNNEYDYSTDSGLTWTQVTDPGGGGWAGAISGDGTKIIIANRSGTPRIGPLGGTLTAINLGDLDWKTKDFRGAACDFTCTNILLANTGGGLFTSSDSGATWKLGTNSADIGFRNLQFEGADINSDGTRMAATVSFDVRKDVYISTDFGVTWRTQNLGMTDPQDVAIASTGSAIYALSGGDQAGNYPVQFARATFPIIQTVACSGGGSFTLENNVVTTSTLNCAGAVVIPDGVTSIAANAFSRYNKLDDDERITSVTIPNTVTAIGIGAFRDNRNVSSLTIGTAVTSIGDDAFNNLYGLTTLVIPGSVTTIGTRAFANVNLTSLTLNEGLVTIGDSAFLGNALVTLVIPNSVTTISTEAAFAGSGLIQTLTLGSGLTTIGNRTFEDSSKLPSLTIPPGVTTLGTNAFRDYKQSTYTYCGTSLTQSVLDSAGLTGKTKTCQVAQTSALTVTSTIATYGSTLTLTTTGGNGSGSISFVVDSGPCTVVGSNLYSSNVGTCMVTATKAASSNYFAASSTSTAITVNKGTPTISLALPASATTATYGTAVTITATVSKAGKVTFKSGGTAITGCTLVSGSTTATCNWTPSAVNASTSLTADFAPDDSTKWENLTAAGSLTVTVGAGSQSITRTSTSPTSPVKSGTYTPTATASSTLPVAITIAAGSSSVCSISEGVVTFNTAGSCVIQYNQIGNSNYSAATQLTETLSIGKATPTFSAWSDISKNYGDSSFPVTAPTVTGSLDGTFTYSSATTSVIGVSGSTLTVAGAGTSVITATFTPTDTTNYNSATTTMTVTVSKAVLSITASSHTVAYGAAIPTITPTYSGFVNGDTSSVVTASICSTTYTTTTAVGSATSSCTGATASNYSFTYTPGVITIEKAVQATLVGTAGQTMWAWVELPFSSITTSGGNGTGAVKFTVASGPCAVSGTTLTATSGGTCSLIAVKEADTNYLEKSSTAFSFTVVKGAPTVTQSLPAGATTATYGTAVVITATVQYAGTVTFKAGTTEICNSVTANLTATCSWTPNSAVSTILTIDYVPTNTNWYISRTAVGSLTINVGKAALSITASSHTVAFGDAVPTITPTYSGFVNGDASSAITAPTCSTTYTTTTGVGSVASSCSGATASNYSFTYTAGVITITQAGQTSVLAITSTTVIYGSTLSLITSGGDGGGSNSFLVNSGPCTVSGSTLTPTAVGTCMVTATKAASSNYLATSSSSTAIAVTPKGLTVSGLTGVNKEFDRGLAGTVTGTPTLVGVVGSDNVLLGGTPTFTFASANAGSAITLTASGYTLTGTTASNYTLTQPAVTANITAKAARVAATNTTVAFGAPVTSGVTVSGLISPDAVGSASYTYTGTGTSTPPTAVGVYTVTPSNAVFSTGLIGNYTISYDTATVTILAKYTITYNANGGAIGSSSTTSADFVVGDNALALPTATREGFNFLGWFTLQSSGVQVTGAYTPISTGTLWAHWIQKSLVGVGNSQKIGTITTLANVGNTYSATSSSGTVAVTYAANALPVGTVIDIYQMADSSRASSMISSTNNYVLSLVVAWLTPASTVPLLSANDALTMVITDSAIKKGAKVYSLIGSESTLLGTATADGSVTVRILEDPEVYIAITKPDAPTGVSATSGGDATSTISWIAPSDGGSAITLYTATSNAGQTCSTATTSCSVTGLTNGTPYTFTVTATNAIGISDPSAPSSAATPSAPAAPVVVTPPTVTTPSSGGGGGGGPTYVAPTTTVDPEAAAAAAAAAKALAEKAATEAKLAAEAKAVADAKEAADKKAAEEAELLATLKALQEKADAEALAAAKKVADELAAAQLKAEEELKASAALKLAEEQRIAAERAVAAKKITTVYSLSAAFKLNTTYTNRLKTNTTKIAAGSTVTCIGYAKSSKTLTYAKAKVVATKQAKALCSSMKKINPTLKTKSTVLPASKAPKSTVNKKWIPVSYRVERAIN
jgi:hypothetical protein